MGHESISVSTFGFNNLDTDEPCKWTISINVKTKFNFENTFSNFTLELKFKVILKIEKHIKSEISKLKFKIKS